MFKLYLVDVWERMCESKCERLEDWTPRKYPGKHITDLMIMIWESSSVLEVRGEFRPFDFHVSSRRHVSSVSIFDMAVGIIIIVNFLMSLRPVFGVYSNKQTYKQKKSMTKVQKIL